MGTDTEPQPVPQRRATWRMGTRERIRLQWLAVAVIIILLAIGIRPSILVMIATRDYTLCQTNVRSISRGLRMYSQEWDDTLPPATTWMDNVSGYMAPTSRTGFKLERYFKCPDDHSAGPTSYVYNDLFTSLHQSTVTTDPAAQARLRQIGRVDRAPLMIERYGGGRSAHMPLPDWTGVQSAMTLPHDLPDPTGSLIWGNLAVSRVTKEDVATRAGQKF